MLTKGWKIELTGVGLMLGALILDFLVTAYVEPYKTTWNLGFLIVVLIGFGIGWKGERMRKTAQAPISDSKKLENENSQMAA